MTYQPTLKTPPVGPIKGANIVCRASDVAAAAAGTAPSCWARYMADFPWDGSPSSINGQIAAAAGMGCNQVRLILNGGSGSWASWSGRYTLSQFLAKLGTIVAECGRYGIAFNAAIGGQNEYQGYQTAPGGNGAVTGFGAITAWAASICEFLAGFPNVNGVDLCQEAFSVTFAGMEALGATNLTDGQCSALLAALKAACDPVAPGLPKTFSWTTTDYRLPLCATHSDYTDVHVYDFLDPTTVRAGIEAYSQCHDKQLLIGEYGRSLGDVSLSTTGSAGVISWLTAVQADVIDATYTNGITCVGGNVWSIGIQSPTPGDTSDYGLINPDGSLRAAGTWISTHPLVAPMPLDSTTRRRRVS